MYVGTLGACNLSSHLLTPTCACQSMMELPGRYSVSASLMLRDWTGLELRIPCWPTRPRWVSGRSQSPWSRRISLRYLDFMR